MKISTIVSSAFLAFSFVAPISFASEPEVVKEAGTAVVNVEAEKVLAVLKADPKIVVIDIRTPEEFEAGHLEKATNIDFQAETFKAELAKLDKEKTYLMHCRSGGRSTASLPVWKELGFKRVIHLNTGILGAEKAGIELVKGKK
jgi:rhodanese-related sulfurtransferase